MRLAIFTLLIAGVLLKISVSVAGENAYMCQVAHVYSLADDQSLIALPALETELRKHTFAVSRETGQVVSESAVATSQAKDVRVLSKGSRDNSFRAIADYGRYPNGSRPFRLLEIQEYAETEAKPFVLTSEIGIITGTCK
jgi:hypothetical protein